MEITENKPEPMHPFVDIDGISKQYIINFLEFILFSCEL